MEGSTKKLGAVLLRGRRSPIGASVVDGGAPPPRFEREDRTGVTCEYRDFKSNRD